MLLKHSKSSRSFEKTLLYLFIFSHSVDLTGCLRDYYLPNRLASRGDTEVSSSISEISLIPFSVSSIFLYLYLKDSLGNL